ncbi:MAG: SusC/RagA family TonB-linked outer membrane protein [Saprospiraceae bacterium]|nr:SusC/RagA family TonB-linked outer membrane protein [Saprospiraceae bacterium]
MKKFFTKLGFAALLVILSQSFAFSQQTISGTVTDSNGDAVIGANIIVKGTTVGTISDVDGSYSLVVPEGGTTLEVSYLGYLTQEILISDNTYGSIVMADDINQLDEIVVTGLASNVKRSNLANSVESLGAVELTGITSQPTMEGALYGKLKGADIRSNSGAPGGGMSIKLRGVTSIFGGQQPLYIVDGIFVDNSTISLGTNIVSAAAGGGNTATNQDDASNRIADLVTEDIESIEVLKGASASGIYGSRAAAGVVIITTKRGKAGETKVNFNQTVGVTSAIKLLGQRDFTDRSKVVEIFGESAGEAFDQNGLTDYEKELYGNSGFLSTSQLSVSGGNDKTTYYLSGVHKDEEGIVQNTGYVKSSARANITHKFNDWLKLDFTSNYVNAQSDRGFFNNGNTNTTIGYAQAFTNQWENLFQDESGIWPAGGAGSNILETVDQVKNEENVNRFFNSAIVNARIFSTENQSLKFVGTYGRDQYNLRTEALFPGSLSFFRADGTLGGVAIQGNTRSLINRLAGFLVHNFYMDNGLSFTTQAGLTGENFDRNTVIATATGLSGVETSLSQAANQSVFQNVLIQKDRGFFVQEEVNYDDKILFTLGLRGDKSTNNGDANKLYYYPKGNFAVNIHKFDFWNEGGLLNQLKVRAAYGEAGTFAGFNDRFNLLNGTLIDGNAGLISSTQRGNTNVGPERQKELELGFDLAMLDNKISLEATFYNKNVDDVLLRAQVPTSTGFTTQVVNAAALNNKGVELSLGLRPIETENFKWTTQFNWWKNKSEVTRLDVPAFNLGGFAASLGQYRIQEGESATQIVGTFNPEDCETGDCSDLDPDGDGFRVYGNAEADFNLGWINNISYGNFDFSMVWHLKQGGEGVNLSTLLYDLGNTTWDYDDVTLDPSGEMNNGDYRTSTWRAGNAGSWIEDASYLRMREIGVYYNVPESMVSFADLRIGFSGRNLINIFDYNSYDPEVSNFGGNVLANSIEVTPFPSSKRINFHISATF